MHVLYASVATLAVAIIYCLWRTDFEIRIRREQTLRERVAYMLWTVAEYSP
jgi:hypothetical protein